MTSVLTAAVSPELKATNKAPARDARQDAVDDNAGFAQVLAIQLPLPPADTATMRTTPSTSPRDHAAITATSAKTRKLHTAVNIGGAQHQTDAHIVAATSAAHTDTRTLAAANDSKNLTHHHSLLPSNASELPDQFQQIIAALPKPGQATPIDSNNVTLTDNAAPNRFSTIWQHQSSKARQVHHDIPVTAKIRQHQTHDIRHSEADTQTGSVIPDSFVKSGSMAVPAIPAGNNHAHPDTPVISGGVIPFIHDASHAPDTATPIVSADINRGLAAPQWGSEFSHQITALIRQSKSGLQIAELRLDPPELGPLRVTINLNDSIVHAAFSSAHAAVRSAIEQALPQLQQQLAQEGLSLGQTHVGQQDTAQSGSGQSENQDNNNAVISGSRHQPEQPDASDVKRPRILNALIDTFA